MTSICLTFSSKCNISCAHCCFSCGPHSEDHLSEEQSVKIVDDAIANAHVNSIGFSGGEALLHRNLLLSLMKRASEGNLKTTLVSNGFWGHSVANAQNILTLLKNAGLSTLTLSFDEFHEKFIPTQRIINILQANKYIGIPCHISMAVTKDHTGEELIHDLGEAGFTIPITRFPVVPVGAAAQLPKENIYSHYDANDPLICPGLQITYHFNGDVYPCCSPAVFHTCLSIGEVSNTPTHTALERVSRNKLFALMQRIGLRGIAEICKEHGIGPDLTKVPVVDPCDLCRKIFANSKTLEALLPYIDQAYRKTLPDKVQS
ncbi:peptide modification radical SAM enzyme, YydG family [Bifidobacterium bohemicum]|uniref:Radical SAM domain protein n=2 Tax=Bifidobacterium bohemicum TaxID=638617 RepID=A0A086ZJX1_9BIFI|nr:radical SAM domain protein [Bifidobacterium bohemicum DSM 22767]SCB82249.1 peptide modification radical SAM enzyme, YydG family [Bifidobacterium bohemicum]